MGRRQEQPGKFASQGEMVSPGDGRRSVYITDIIRTGTNGCKVGEVGPFSTPNFTFSYNFSTPFAAATGFEVPPDHQVIYYLD